jgi:hypothetical protein
MGMDIKEIHLYGDDKIFIRTRVIGKDDPVPENATTVAPPRSTESPFHEEFKIGFLKCTFDEDKQEWYEAATREDAQAFVGEIDASMQEQQENNTEFILGSQLTQKELEDIKKDRLIEEMGREMVQMRLELIKLRKGETE